MEGCRCIEIEAVGTGSAAVDMVAVAGDMGVEVAGKGFEADDKEVAAVAAVDKVAEVVGK